MKIERYFDKKEKKEKFRTRFQLNNKEFYPSADSRKRLSEIIDEIRASVHRSKYDLIVPQFSPTLEQLFTIHAPRIPKPHQRKIFERVSILFLSLIPDDLKITELKKAHFQKYIDLRRSQFGKQTGQPVLDETIDKELYSISSALRSAPLYFAELDGFQKPEIPKAAKGGKRRRDRLVNESDELTVLLAELRRGKSGGQTVLTEQHRRRLADDLEFRFETGLRRKEAARLKKAQYVAGESALRNVVRWKTGTVTKFFPLSVRAAAIIESRLKINIGEFVFTKNGEPVESDYRTLREVCKTLGIVYGRYAVGGFVPHDLRRSFATNIIQHTDIETTRELLGHSNITQTSVYLSTNEDRLREAVRKGEKENLLPEIARIYKAVKRGKIRLREMAEIIEKMVKK